MQDATRGNKRGARHEERGRGEGQGRTKKEGRGTRQEKRVKKGENRSRGDGGGWVRILHTVPTFPPIHTLHTFLM